MSNEPLGWPDRPRLIPITSLANGRSCVMLEGSARYLDVVKPLGGEILVRNTEANRKIVDTV